MLLFNFLGHLNRWKIHHLRSNVGADAKLNQAAEIR